MLTPPDRYESVQPGVDREVDAVEDLLRIAEVRRPGHDVVDETEAARRDVVEPADLLPGVRQPWVGRRRDAVRLEVARRNGQVVGDQEVAVPRPEVAEVDRQALAQLVLDATSTPAS